MLNICFAPKAWLSKFQERPHPVLTIWSITLCKLLFPKSSSFIQILFLEVNNLFNEINSADSKQSL